MKTLPRPLWRRACSFLPMLLLVSAVACFLTQRAPVHASSAATPPLSNPDASCAQCHAAIVASYSKTSMARGSGLAVDALDRGSFTSASSGVTYKISEQDGIPRLRSSRDSEQAPLDDTEQLAYFIGSGKHGRTYLFRRDNGNEKLWYEAPVNRYTRRAAYGMAPAGCELPTLPHHRRATAAARRGKRLSERAFSAGGYRLQRLPR